MSNVLISKDTINNINKALENKVPDRQSSTDIDDIISQVNVFNQQADSYVKSRLAGSVSKEDSPDLSEYTALRGSAIGNIVTGRISLPNCISIGADNLASSNITEIDAPECVELYSKLSPAATLINFPKLKTLHVLSDSIFYANSSTTLTDIDFPLLDTINIYAEGDNFHNKNVFESYYNKTLSCVNLPKLKTINNNYSNCIINTDFKSRLFSDVSLNKIYLPELTNINYEIETKRVAKYGYYSDIYLADTDSVANLVSIDLPKLTNIVNKVKNIDSENEYYPPYVILSGSYSSIPKLTRINIRNFSGIFANGSDVSVTNHDPTPKVYIQLSKLPELQLIDLGCSQIQINADRELSFTSAPKLTTIILRNTSTVCTIKNTSGIIDNLAKNENAYAYVPATLINDYKTATNWVTVADKFRAIEDYPDIVNYSMEE